MPELDLTELEAKVLWLIMDRIENRLALPDDLKTASDSLFAKAYRAYRGMPPGRAA